MERVELDGHLPSYANRAAWGSSQLVDTDFLFNPYGAGWHLDRRRFDAMLVESAAEAGVNVQAATLFKTAHRTAEGWRVEYLTGRHRETAAAGFLIDCSGRAATLARSQGERRVRHDRLVAVVALLRPSVGEDCDSTTTIEAVRDGWWYTALLPGGLRVMAYLTDLDLIVRPEARSPEGWLGRLAATEHMRQFLERFDSTIEAGPWLVPAESAHLTAPVGVGWIAAGDAAGTYDPLSSQGIVMALTTGLRAARAVVGFHHDDRSALQGYALGFHRLYRSYLNQRIKYYQIEVRWQESPFWRRRS
jgi:flavin-dependent dehydrogenase